MGGDYGYKMIKVLYIASLNIPVCYWRIENYAEQFVKMKTKVKVNVEYFNDIIDIGLAWDDACVGKGDISIDIQRKLKNAFKFFDVIIFQRIQNLPGLALIEELRKEYPNVKIVTELDDSVGEVSPSSPYRWEEQNRYTADFIHKSDAAICSTEYLKKSILPIIGDKPIHVAPNCINKKTWKPGKLLKNETDTIRVGYVAGGGHEEDILIAYRAMKILLEENNKLEFVIRFGGFRPKWLKHHDRIDFKSIAWDVEEYPRKINELKLDLALAPLRDSEFNRCKSNLKWLEMSSIGVPVLCSNSEPYKKIKDAYLTSDNSVSSWVEKLTVLIELIKSGDIKRDKDLIKAQYKDYNLYKESIKLLNFLKSL